MTKYTDYKEAGKIAKKVVEELKKEIEVGTKLLDIAEEGEQMMREMGGEPAFPINLSLNEIAAHYTPVSNDKNVLGEDLLKVDIGVHVNGFIADTAFSVDLTGKYSKMVEAVETALKEAIKIAVPGVDVKDIGKRIEETIKSYGYKPVSNLSGHLLKRYKLHAGLTVPNVHSGSGVLEEGMVVAIEPFATDGVGMIKEAPNAMIFQFRERKPVRMREAKRILKTAEQRFNKLPFASRWIKLPKPKKMLAINQLLQAKALYSYPMLIEKGRGMISQAEHTVIVGKKPEVTTC